VHEIAVYGIERLAHDARGGLAEKEHGAQIDVENTVPLLRRHVPYARSAHNACVVDEHVDATEALDRGFYELRRRIGRRELRDEPGAALAFADVRPRLLHCFRAGAGKGDARSLRQERFHHGKPDTASPSGHQSGFACKSRFILERHCPFRRYEARAGKVKDGLDCRVDSIVPLGDKAILAEFCETLDLAVNVRNSGSPTRFSYAVCRGCAIWCLCSARLRCTSIAES